MKSLKIVWNYCHLSHSGTKDLLVLFHIRICTKTNGLIRVVHSESHPIVLSGRMLIPSISNLGSILHWFWPHYLWSCVRQFLWEKILHLMFCWHFSHTAGFNFLEFVAHLPIRSNITTIYSRFVTGHLPYYDHWKWKISLKMIRMHFMTKLKMIVSIFKTNWTWRIILQIPRMKLHIQHTEDAKVTLVIGNRNNVIEHFSDEGN